MLKPISFGAAMAAMMLWMLHGAIIAGTANLSWGAIVFSLAHVALVGALLILALSIPCLGRVFRHHRPGVTHVFGMVLGMVLSAGAIHLAIHGGFA